jgi:hypothetical protein
MEGTTMMMLNIARRMKRHRKRQARYRQCKGCKICCVPCSVVAIGKGHYVPCEFLNENGCSIHNQERHPICEGFQCGWLSGALGPEYNPNFCHFALLGPKLNTAYSLTDSYSQELLLRHVERMSKRGLPVLLETPTIQRLYESPKKYMEKEKRFVEEPLCLVAPEGGDATAQLSEWTAVGVKDKWRLLAEFSAVALDAVRREKSGQ